MNFCKKTVIAACLLAVTPFSQASAPFSQVENPGFYHFKLGRYQITALSDGVSELPLDKLLINEPWSKIQHLAAINHLRNPATTSVNAYMINTGEKLILIDAGSGDFMGSHLGKVSQALKSAGYTPEQVDEIFITHLHPDHIGGLIQNGNPVYKNATLWIDKKEADYWLNKDSELKADETEKPFFSQAVKAVEPYIKAGKVRFYSDSHPDSVITRITSEGHTPGHVFYKVTSDGASLVMVGDLLHVGDVQLEDPNVAIRFDTEPKRATETRIRFLKEFAVDGDLIAASHLAFPGVGYVMKAESGYRWKPVSYGADIR
ncbi:MBL fold metallo-hydrolase [Pantoea anthophila]|uniref:MBL fold metallo-hydrolase n=1 Tax=Pantoea anthophila TaxID=470931 RepID=UPI002DBDAC00|nr:MBL fold metallo-hydrolase [Pantoea anthophila]MEB7538552.1 MBL fold metallo-hydrolase [Pantoea anthophila]